MSVCNRCENDRKTWCFVGRFNGKNIDQQKPITGKCESFERIKIIKVE